MLKTVEHFKQELQNFRKNNVLLSESEFRCREAPAAAAKPILRMEECAYMSKHTFKK